MWINDIALGLLQEDNPGETSPVLACRFDRSRCLVVVAADGRKHFFPFERVADYLDRLKKLQQNEKGCVDDPAEQAGSGADVRRAKVKVRRRVQP